MVVAIEAKRCDITKTKHQNFEAMEASICTNKHMSKSYRAIKGVRTDFHSRVFVSRDKRSILTSSTPIGLTNDIEVPPSIE
ncbi:hypothetical protein PF010_g25685 [Phytophthora fragariae]|uniref:Uncharacterized protein n=1 Tax=Phytophthora fragariae TaxID=53985 RepID=A0A6G0JZ40_9STRA|nr:hypothetical protein PF010_g25685 [Phytophthora fragariae]KAE9179488.1 hypothetical protein PF004_g25142 [Phytophthora fragariae]KAE9289923.1 hypothetical protein PF008_g25768 [Phytophthora fragariae]